MGPTRNGHFSGPEDELISSRLSGFPAVNSPRGLAFFLQKRMGVAACRQTVSDCATAPTVTVRQ